MPVCVGVRLCAVVGVFVRLWVGGARSSVDFRVCYLKVWVGLFVVGGWARVVRVHAPFFATARLRPVPPTPLARTTHTPTPQPLTHGQVRRPNNYDVNMAVLLGPTDPNPAMELAGLDIVRTVVADSPNKVGACVCCVCCAARVWVVCL